MPRWLGALLHALPRGTVLPEATWRSRHRGITILLLAHMPLLLGLALFGGEDQLISKATFEASSIGHSLIEVGIIGLLAAAAMVPRFGRRTRSLAASFGLVTCSALLTHFSGGFIEAHFHFFVMVGVISMYQDWVPFMLGIAYVAIHHGVAGSLDPSSVYNHAAAIAHPWRWGLIHAFFILGLSTVELVHWRAAEKEHSRTELVLRSAGEGILGVDRDGIITFANPRAVDLMGVDESALLGTPASVVFTSEAAATIAGAGPLAALREATDHARGETWLEPDDKLRRRPVEWLSTPMIEGGRYVGAVITFKDISDRRQAERALKRHAKELDSALSLLNATLDATADGILVVDNGRRITSANRRFQELWRVPDGVLREGDDQEVLAMVLEQLEDPEAFLAKVNELYAAPHAESVDLLHFKDGRIFERLSRPQTIDGDVVGRVWSFRDVTAAHRAREDLEERADQLARSNAELERFAYVASHDLQEPLRMVSSYVQLLQRRYGDALDDDAQAYIGYAVEGSQRMHALLRGLLTYSRVEREARAPESIAVDDLLDQVLDTMRPQLEAREIEVERGPLPAARGDRTQLGQVFQNLVANALKFHDGTQPPRVAVEGSVEGGWCHYTVRDNGIGIPAAYHEQVFEIFERLNDRGQYPGTGVGLAICKKIVEGHGGRIWIESEVGEGATFHVLLPADKDDADTMVDHGAAALHRSGGSSKTTS